MLHLVPLHTWKSKTRPSHDEEAGRAKHEEVIVDKERAGFGETRLSTTPMRRWDIWEIMMKRPKKNRILRLVTMFERTLTPFMYVVCNSMPPLI